MTGRILYRIFSADALGLILVLIALRVLTLGIASSLRNTDTSYFFWVCLVAALLSFGLSRRNVNGLLASAGIAALGFVGVWILGARLSGPLLELSRASFQLVAQIIPAIRSAVPLDTTAVADAWLIVTQASDALSQRVQVWLRSIDRSVMVNDALVRNMVWLLIMWLLAAWLGWFSGRRNAIAALLPPILLLAFITSYSERRIETLWAMVFILLLLLGLWNYKNHTVQWERKKVDYSDSIRYDLGQAVILLSIAVGVMAFITPSISWRQVLDFVRERGENEMAEMLGVQQQQVAAQGAPVQEPALPRVHLLTGGSARSEEIVMTIRTGELPPVANPVFAESAPRYYWRSTVYDTYVGTGWVTSSAIPQNIQPDTPLMPGLLNGYRSLHLDVELIQPEGKLFWSGILFSADVPFRADWRVRPPSSLFADQAALLQSDLFAALSRADAYTAQAYVPLVALDELRTASGEYPEEIRERYLRLPRSVPDRVHRLAREITRGKASPYDQAKAIEAHLRTYPYDLDVPAPPEGEDLADYFLFELKKGYCDYYASAMVVLARASGLPARFVSGYAPGSYDAANAQYIVRELHAHSWAEVYFPGIGWIEFEPTASQPEILIPEQNEAIVAPPSESTPAQMLYRLRLETVLYWLSPLLIALLALGIYFMVIEPWWYLRHFTPALAIERIYRRLYRLGRPLAGERTRAETAYEFMHKLTGRLEEIRAQSRFKDSFPNTGQDLELLTDLYQGTLFRDREMQRQDVASAWNTWKRLRRRLVLARLSVAARGTPGVEQRQVS